MSPHRRGTRRGRSGDALLLLNAFAILLGLSAAVFATFATRLAAAAALAAAFIGAALAFSAVRFPSPSGAAGLIALAAGTMLWRPHWPIVAAAAGGLAAALWAVLLVAEGLPGSAVFPAVVVVVSSAAALAAARPSFAPTILQEEALMIVAVLGLLVAAAPSVIEGFGSAIAFTGSGLPDDAEPQAPWALALAAAFIALGAIYSLWKHRS